MPSVINEIQQQDIEKSILEILLQDKTTKKNIIWATNDYAKYGLGYSSSDTIDYHKITGIHSEIIMSRVSKSKLAQQERVKNKAEVFTPSWVCNAQNNLIDEAWFGRKNVFNIEDGNHWITTVEKVIFPDEPSKTWCDYVKANRLEITCGEAPYIASRYDAVSGTYISIKYRIGILDRKLRIVNENTKNKEEWLVWIKNAFKSVYAYDWQGDNVLLARKNLYFTFLEYYENRFFEKPPIDLCKEIAEIIAWNVWQMDGLKCVIPNSCHNEIPLYECDLLGEQQPSKFCEGCAKNKIKKHNGIYCKIMDWDTNRANKFVNLLGRK